MIWVARTAASIGRASSACSRRSAKAASGLCSRSRRPGWRATAATGMLIEFCGLVGTIIVDEDGIYDPRHPNDRLLLGMKGTMSELELSLFRQRSHEALKQKARRGALFLGVAAGYVRIGHDRIDKGHVRQAGGDSRLKRRRQRCGGLGGKSSAVRDAAGAIDGLADCAASGAPLSSPAPPVHRCEI